MDDDQLRRDDSVGPELALAVAMSALPRQFETEAARALTKCAGAAEYEHRLEDILDRVLGRVPPVSEPGLFCRLVITETDGEIEITREDGAEAEPERVAKVRAVLDWERKLDVRRVIEEHVAPLIEARKRWWLRRWNERSGPALSPNTPVE